MLHLPAVGAELLFPESREKESSVSQAVKGL